MSSKRFKVIIVQRLHFELILEATDAAGALSDGLLRLEHDTEGDIPASHVEFDHDACSVAEVAAKGTVPACSFTFSIQQKGKWSPSSRRFPTAEEAELCAANIIRCSGQPGDFLISFSLDTPNARWMGHGVGHIRAGSSPFIVEGISKH